MGGGVRPWGLGRGDQGFRVVVLRQHVFVFMALHIRVHVVMALHIRA